MDLHPIMTQIPLCTNTKLQKRLPLHISHFVARGVCEKTSGVVVLKGIAPPLRLQDRSQTQARSQHYLHSPDRLRPPPPWKCSLAELERMPLLRQAAQAAWSELQNVVAIVRPARPRVGTPGGTGEWRCCLVLVRTHADVERIRRTSLCRCWLFRVL